MSFNIKDFLNKLIIDQISQIPERINPGAVDGNLKIRGVPAEKQMPIVKGDGRIASISAASILAKVFRDRYMDKLEELYPGYGFDKHAGYGTKAHLDAIRRLGYTPAHRKSFHPKSL